MLRETLRIILFVISSNNKITRIITFFIYHYIINRNSRIVIFCYNRSNNNFVMDGITVQSLLIINSRQCPSLHPPGL